MRKNVLVRNPAVSLDNISVFANRARQEKIVKNPVCYFYSLVVMEFLSDTLVVTSLYVS